MFTYLICVSLSIAFLSMLLSLAEASIVGFSRFKACNLVKQKLYGANHLIKLHEKRSQVLSTIIMMNTGVNLAGSMWVGVIASKVFHGTEYGIFVGCLSLFMLLFAEAKPKVFASQYPEKVARFLALPMLFLTFVLRPVTILMELIIGGKSDAKQLTEHEVKAIVSEATKEGLFGCSEGKLVGNLFSLRNQTADSFVVKDGSVMTLPLSVSIEDVLPILLDSKYKRLVAVNRAGLPVGVVLVGELLAAHTRSEKEKMVSDHVHPITNISSNCALGELLSKLFRSPTHMGVVLSEDNEMIGVITLSNVIEHLLQ
ncbi:CNNM domain-containing protein [Vibrio sp. D431a]|uniref:CNNM domain-containing protein n=1 Tax=Vibrio sp. D431a TaxID=2837388 RepID=UPI0025548370|nr:CNNM domain-containing protein [Vibrio sp. D431a]MDK9790631.1 DUF21 domain-containing protein [Vibrio sp. D431a]